MEGGFIWQKSRILKRLVPGSREEETGILPKAVNSWAYDGPGQHIIPHHLTVTYCDPDLYTVATGLLLGSSSAMISPYGEVWFGVYPKQC